MPIKNYSISYINMQYPNKFVSRERHLVAIQRIISDAFQYTVRNGRSGVLHGNEKRQYRRLVENVRIL